MKTSRFPSTWEDKNDSKVILEYKNRKNISKLFAICFSIGDETIHSWKTYANGISGCCIQFDENRFLKTFKRMKEIRFGDVTYYKVPEVKDNTIELDQMPFIKRHPYRIEHEFRILWEGHIDQDSVDIDIDLNSIDKITISQNMPVVVYNTIVELLQENMPDPETKINRSTLYENRRWLKAFKDNKQA